MNQNFTWLPFSLLLHVLSFHLPCHTNPILLFPLPWVISPGPYRLVWRVKMEEGGQVSGGISCGEAPGTQQSKPGAQTLQLLHVALASQHVWRFLIPAALLACHITYMPCLKISLPHPIWALNVLLIIPYFSCILNLKTCGILKGNLRYSTLPTRLYVHALIYMLHWLPWSGIPRMHYFPNNFRKLFRRQQLAEQRLRIFTDVSGKIKYFGDWKRGI